jgi:membrane-anchored protein YejM (alkaline phosphatase superfamily)
MASPRNIICIVIDRLHSGFLGGYGNTWISTPHLDQLAAESFVFDRAIIDSTRLESLYRSYWQGFHALASPAVTSLAMPAIGLPRLLAEAGYTTVLMSDDPTIRELPLAEDFHDIDEIRPVTNDQVANSIEETQLARFFAAASERLTDAGTPFCLWLHIGSLGWIWDAPLEFRNQYADADDPQPPENALVPSKLLSRDFDPDELLGIVHSYAGQVSLLDLCVGSFLEAVAESPAAADTLLALVSARGLSMGEHGRVGPAYDSPYGEVTQVPWFLRFPDGLGQSSRTQALAQPADLFSTLAEWCGLSVSKRDSSAAGRSLIPLVQGASDSARDRACYFAAADDWAIATSAWYLVQRGQRPEARGQESTEGALTSRPATEGCQLFVKPDDRFEVNDVADRCPDCVPLLQEAFDQFRQACQTADSTDLPPLSEVLVSGYE